MSFYTAFDELIGFEGGYVDDPLDTGGETKWGISKRAFPHLDIKNLTKDDAALIYRSWYWDPLYLDDLISEQIATEIFEQAVNLGLKRATQHVQRSLELLGCALDVDGVMGPQTINTLNQCSDTKTLLKCLNGFQFIWYAQIVQNNPSQRRFIIGWLKRIS